MPRGFFAPCFFRPLSGLFRCQMAPGLSAAFVRSKAQGLMKFVFRLILSSCLLFFITSYASVNALLLFRVFSAVRADIIDDLSSFPGLSCVKLVCADGYFYVWASLWGVYASAHLDFVMN